MLEELSVLGLEEPLDGKFEDENVKGEKVLDNNDCNGEHDEKEKHPGDELKDVEPNAEDERAGAPRIAHHRPV